MTIGELYDACDECWAYNVVFIVEDKEIKASGKFYVESEIVFWYPCEDNETPATGKEFVRNIQLEAEDSCWQKTGFRAKNTYDECEIAFISGDSVFNIVEIITEKNKIKLICQ